ncbi:uncharacterized protein BYT42DRAFT_339 [Radiomyces spectabilis]|uniref:uncharacterized protein n=1 Tax=Radiomyces spectabilis TaxID=64574 RepID=UPI00221F137C|nr:uncharacterized protein BYT42DRAFT_339 [Radiomyces spectabilis]KAI8393264.1 hypothetical protein BYT42DRAFT_339 [Radiomyces spectabilis]
MSSLADELAADLDFSDEENNSDYNEQDTNETMETDEADVTARRTSDSNTTEDPDDVRKISNFLYSNRLQDVLKQIDHFEAQKRSAHDVKGPTEEDDEYKLSVQANALTADIDNEMQAVHKFIRDSYAPKFPELESLVLNPLDYARTVKAIGNETDLTKIDLRSILPSATVMVITVTGTTTSGRPLTAVEWKRTDAACDMIFELDAARKKIMTYVESRMALVAPNLSNIIGSSTAAKLLTAAGGLTAFCKIPACNVMLLGKVGKASTGFSSASMEKHTGYIYYSDLVYSVPADLRRRVAKIIANKCALAARIDSLHTSPDGQKGREMREAIDQTIEKLQEPPPSKNVKALPVPDEGPKKRRGGRRVRRMKEAYAMTELRAARNRMAFGEAEEEVEYGDETEGLGMAAKQIGKIRASVADARNKVKAPKLKSYHTSGTATSGLASSLSFSTIQGIELRDPTAATDRVNKANEKYFGDGAFSILPKK